MSTGQPETLDLPTQARPRDPLRPARYVLPTSIVYGKGTLDQLPALLSELGVSNPLIVTDRGLAATSIPRQVIDVLAAAGIKCDLFAEVESDPSTTVVDQIAQVLPDEGDRVERHAFGDRVVPDASVGLDRVRECIQPCAGGEAGGEAHRERRIQQSELRHDAHRRD